MLISSLNRADSDEISVIPSGLEEGLIHGDGLLEMAASALGLSKSPEVTGKIVVKNGHFEESFRAAEQPVAGSQGIARLVETERSPEEKLRFVRRLEAEDPSGVGGRIPRLIDHLCTEREFQNLALAADIGRQRFQFEQRLIGDSKFEPTRGGIQGSDDTHLEFLKDCGGRMQSSFQD
jgi:hypothetical protein